MRAPKQHSINQKLALIVVAAVLAAVTIIAGAALWRDAERHTQAKVEYLNVAAAVFGSATSEATAAHDMPGALVALRGVARTPHLVYARVTTSDGQTLAEIGQSVALESDARVREGDAPSVFDALASDTIEVSQPIVQGGVEVGRITLAADNSDLLPSLWTTLLQTLFGAAIAIAVGLAVLTRLHPWVVRPLLKLTDVVRHISASHEYGARVDIASDDEVGELCSGFNTMLGEIQDRERRIVDLATHDAETDLPNRIALEREIDARLAKGKTGLVVAAIGVDRFQYVREAIGYHLAGDLLSELGARAMCFTDGMFVARISTDAIGVLMRADDAAAAEALGAAMLVDAETPMQLGANNVDVNLNMGVALHGQHAETPQALIERAIIALDQARATGAKCALFNDAAYEETRANLNLMADMMRALAVGDGSGLAIDLQPKFDLKRAAITGAEVLVRWRHPDRGFIAPDVFVRMAEETGAIAPLTHWVLQETLACQRRLREAGLDLSLAMNLSGRLVGDADFVAAALPLLAQADGRFILEITETASFDSQEHALKHIEAFVAAGVKISIDDYGAGLSSLSYLKRIPADELKIDKGFVQSLGESQRDALLVKSTIDLAHSLGMKVTAEGVETEAVLTALAAMGCDKVQGFFIGKPVPEADFVRRFAKSGQVEKLAV